MKILKRSKGEVCNLCQKIKNFSCFYEDSDGNNYCQSCSILCNKCYNQFIPETIHNEKRYKNIIYSNSNINLYHEYCNNCFKKVSDLINKYTIKDLANIIINYHLKIQ